MFKSTAEAQSYRPDDEEKKRKFEDRIHFEFSEHGYTAQFERDKEMWFKALQQPQDERIANILRRIFTILRYGGLLYREDRHSSDWKVWKDTRWSIATILSHGGRVLVQIPKAGTTNAKFVVLGDADRNRTSETLSPPLSAKNISTDTTEVSTNLSSFKPDPSTTTENILDEPTTTAVTTAAQNVEETTESNINSITNSEQEILQDDKNGSKLTSKRNSSNSIASWSSEYSENISHSRRESMETKIIFDESTPAEDSQLQTNDVALQQQETIENEKEVQDEGQKTGDKLDTVLSVEEPTIRIEDSPPTQVNTVDEAILETIQQDIEDASAPTPKIEEENITSPNFKEGEDSSLNTETTPPRTLREPIHERKISLKLDLEKLNLHAYTQSGSQSVPTPNVGSATDQPSSEPITSPHTVPSNSVPSSDSVASSSVSSPTKEHPSRSQTLKPSSRRKTIFSGLFGKKRNSTLSGPISAPISEEVSPQPTAQLPEPNSSSSKSPKATLTPRTEKKKKGFFRFFSKTEKAEVTEKDFWKWLITGDPQCSDKELLKFITLSTSGDQCMDEKRVVFKRVAGSHGITYKRKKKNKDNEHGGIPSSSSTSILETNSDAVASPENNDYDSEGGGDFEVDEDLETISNLSDDELEFEKCPFGRTKILMETKPFGLNSKNSKLVGYSTTTQLKKHRHWGMNIPLGGYNNIAQGMYRIPIEANGRHGHIYFNYMAPTPKHNGGLLIGCESSEYGKTGQNGEMHTIGAHSSTISVTHGYKWRNKICSLENISSVGTPDNLDSMFVDLSYTGWEFLMQCEWKDEFVKESPAELIIRDQSGNLFLPPSDPDEDEWF